MVGVAPECRCVGFPGNNRRSHFCAVQGVTEIRSRRAPSEAKLLHLEEPWNRRTTSLPRLDSSEVRLVPEGTPSLSSEVSHVESSVGFNCDLSDGYLRGRSCTSPWSFLWNTPPENGWTGSGGESSSFRSDGAAEALLPAFSCRENILQMETD